MVITPSSVHSCVVCAMTELPLTLSSRSSGKWWLWSFWCRPTAIWLAIMTVIMLNWTAHVNGSSHNGAVGAGGMQPRRGRKSFPFQTTTSSTVHLSYTQNDAILDCSSFIPSLWRWSHLQECSLFSCMRRNLPDSLSLISMHIAKWHTHKYRRGTCQILLLQCSNSHGVSPYVIQNKMVYIK